MSGGVGPTYDDITLPREIQELEHEDDNVRTSVKRTETNDINSPSKKAGFLPFRQLNSLAVMIILASSGMVSLEDFVFVVFSFIYMHFISIVAFPDPRPLHESRVIAQTKMFRLYMLTAAVIGVLLPVAYILHGIFAGDKEGIKAAAPHLFLLASQIFMEGVAFTDRFSLPIQVFVPVFYNSRRIFTIAEWLRREFSKVGEEHAVSAMRVTVGRGLAVANMAIWCFNLFGFLLPVFLPRAFKKYYSASKLN